MATILDGKRCAAALRAEAAMKVAQILEEEGVQVKLAVVLIGSDPASEIYVKYKHQDCKTCGIESLDIRLDGDVSQSEVLDLVDKLNADESVHGILVQLPLPAHLNKELILERIDPAKDVDGFHENNLGRLVRGQDALRACTPMGIMRLLDYCDIEVAGKEAVVVGRSVIVGKPMALLLLEKNATVTIAHSASKNLEELCSRADIVVSAVGKPEFIGKKHIKKGAVVIDVGMNRNAEGKLCGDVNYAEVEPLSSAITPVPGGVGPMTRAQLMLNTVRACEIILGIG